ncbi:Poly(A) polymerase catalytic subunit [uncultured virus]|nr:Poly(A) polymerase catalytic subunit [uncultured virus]
MELYNIKDLELFHEKMDEIEDKLIEKEKKFVHEPIYEERKQIEKIILDYIKQYKRKIYGGYAQNKLISLKNPKDAFYDPTSINDLDFYSPEPIEDLIRLSNILHEKGFKYVQASEAVHKETYSLFVNFYNSCDISYVHKNIFYRIPFIEIEGVNYVHPSFIYIDLLRIFTDPLISGAYRWRKTFPRFYLLQKYYPFNKATLPLPNINIIPEDYKKTIENIFKMLFIFFKNNQSIILFGIYVYNCFLFESGIINDKQYRQKYSFINIPYYEIISTDYNNDALKIIDLIKQTFKDIEDSISITEYYPFWMFTGYSATINYKNYPFIYIYHYNRRCVPIKKINPISFNEDEIIKDQNSKVQISSFDLTLLMNMIITFKHRVNKDDKQYQFYNIMTSHLIEMRNYYLKKNNKNIFDGTIFQEFIIDCVGDPLDPIRETRILRYLKARSGKGPIVFKYDPNIKHKEPVSNFEFANTSGNPIRNPHNFKIIKLDPEILKQRSREGEIADVNEQIVEEPEEIKTSDSFESNE